MRIELRQPHKSIETLTTEELPDFAILIGRNGAGKTQLLQAINEGTATIPGTARDEIELYDMTSFGSPNSGQANRAVNQFARNTADAYLLSSPEGRSAVKTAEEIFAQYIRAIEGHSSTGERDVFVRNLRDEIRLLPDFAVFTVSGQPSEYKNELHEKVLAAFIPAQAQGRGRNSSNQPHNSFNNNQAALLSAAMKLSGRLPHELTYDDIMSAAHYEGAILSNSISVVFAAYKVDQFIWAHKRIEKECVEFSDLMAEYRTMYPPPWETLRNIMSEMREAAGDDGLFDFDFSDPGGHEINMGNYERFSFKAEMTNRTTGATYELDSLSSGERVLMALCLASFNQYLGRRRPKLLLLDELDAVLHPSMVAALVRTLKELFLPNGTKILMTSHSPMTAAAVDETDIFRIQRTGADVYVSHTTKADAINELSEGLATIDEGLRIAAYDKARVAILTEGNNVKHLSRWVRLNFAEDVHVIDGLEQHTNKAQLLAYGRLLGKMSTTTHFVIVWDCDASSEAEALRKELPNSAKVTPYAFKKRPENTLARNGIENNYDEEILIPFSIEKTEHGGKWLGREFPKNRKSDFADHVLLEGTAEYFTHFQELRETISGILGLPCEPSWQNARTD